MPSIPIDDLIGITFLDGGSTVAGANCVGVGRMALERIGAVLEPGDLPLTDKALVSAVTALADNPGQSAWTYLGRQYGAATRLGDLVLSRTADGSHVAVMVDSDRRICITACQPIKRDGELIRKGETYACASRRIRGVFAVYRLKQLDNANGGSS